MASRDPVYRAWYKKLLTFYPRPFRERFGESMEQTFNDLCREEAGRPMRLISLTLHLSVDTGLGIVKEHIMHLSKRSTMRDILINPRTTAIVGTLLTLPGAVMVTALMLKTEPPLGPLRPYLEGPADQPHVLGSLLVLALIMVLPALGLIINAGKLRTSLLSAGSLTLATLGGALLTAPFLILQIANNKPPDTVPWPLFGVLWLLVATFIAAFLLVFRALMAKEPAKPRPTMILVGALVMVFTVLMWSGIVIDQIPCFLGVPNCD